jgi:hypothetical protein
VKKPDDIKEAKKAVEERLFPGELGDSALTLDRVTVTAKGDTTVLERLDGAWRITSPVNAAPEKMAIDALTSLLVAALTRNRIEERADEAALVRYGLKPPRFTVHALAHVGDDASRKKELTLLGGVENTFDGTFYVQREGESAVYSAEGGVRWALDKSTYDLRDKAVLDLDEGVVKSIAVKTATNQYALERDLVNQWKLVRPFAAEADPGSVSSIFTALKGERALSFPTDSPEARQAFGLEKPQVDATFTLASGDPVRIRLSTSADAGASAWALREGPGGAVLAELPTTALQDLDRNPLDLKDRSLLRFKSDAVAKLTLRLAEGTVLVAQKSIALDGGPSDAWVLTAPVQGPAKKFRLGQLLYTLNGLRSAALLEEKPKSLAKYGLDARSRELALFDAAGAELARLTLGSPVPEKPGQIYARGSRGQVVELDLARLGDLPERADDLLESPADSGH